MQQLIVEGEIKLVYVLDHLECSRFNVYLDIWKMTFWMLS